ncbi:MAG: hypothetical protein ACRDOE_13870, partial [Streptosporangiaceae bacterium]
FAFYDMMFNVTFVAGAALSSAFMPADGRSPVIVGLVALGYAIAAAAYWMFLRRGQSSPGSKSGGVIPSAAAQRSNS